MERKDERVGVNGDEKGYFSLQFNGPKLPALIGIFEFWMNFEKRTRTLSQGRMDVCKCATQINFISVFHYHPRPKIMVYWYGGCEIPKMSLFFWIYVQYDRSFRGLIQLFQFF